MKNRPIYYFRLRVDESFNNAEVLTQQAAIYTRAIEQLIAASQRLTAECLPKLLSDLHTSKLGLLDD